MVWWFVIIFFCVCVCERVCVQYSERQNVVGLSDKEILHTDLPL